MKQKDKYPKEAQEHVCIDVYETPANVDEWQECPYCKLKPKIWVFDNGRHTACGCCTDDYSIYDHLSIHAESIMSVYKRCNGNLDEYDSDELRKNWNHWCETGEELFPHQYSETGRW